MKRGFLRHTGRAVAALCFFVFAANVIAADPERAETYRQFAMAVLKPQGKLKVAADVLTEGIHRASAPAALRIALREIERERDQLEHAQSRSR